MRIVDLGAIAGSGGGGGGLPTPFFRATLGSSVTPEIGTAGTFSRIGTAYYPDSLSTVAAASTGNPCIPAFCPGLSTSSGGLQIMNGAKNFLLYSEDFTHAGWSAVGGGSASANTAVAPDGNTTADTISGSTSGDGLKQDSGVAAANVEAWTFSVWLKATSGTPSVTLVITDAGSQSNTNAVTLSTTWKRYAVYNKFTSSPTGNVSAQILVGNTSTVRAWGAQLDQANGSAGSSIDQMWGGQGAYGPYVPTTSATATQNQDSLYYAGSEITIARSKCSMLVWAFIPTFTDMWGDVQLASLSSNTFGVEQAVIFSSSSYHLQVEYGGNSGYTDLSSGGNGGAFNQIIVSSDLDADVYAAYVNGTSANTNTTARAPFASNDWLNVGHKYQGDGAIYSARTIIGRVELYSSALSSSDASALYAAQKGVYGL